MSEFNENVYDDVVEILSYTHTPESEEKISHVVDSFVITYTDTDFSPSHLSISKSEENNWNHSLAQITEKCFNSSIEDIFHSIKKISTSSNNDNSMSIVNDAENAFYLYVKESFTKKLNKFATPSEKSLFQLSRFIPELQKLHSSVYIDEKSGCFGVILKTKKGSKPILNLLMKSDKEVAFSFIKKEKGLIKISGRAYFNEHLDDSKEIKNLLRMLKS